MRAKILFTARLPTVKNPAFWRRYASSSLNIKDVANGYCPIVVAFIVSSYRFWVSLMTKTNKKEDQTKIVRAWGRRGTHASRTPTYL